MNIIIELIPYVFNWPPALVVVVFLIVRTIKYTIRVSHLETMEKIKLDLISKAAE